MSAPLSPGDWVECVNAEPMPGKIWKYGDKPTVGAVYQVGDCFRTPDGIDSVSLVGRERVRASREEGFRIGYGVWRFRPIYRPKADLIESLLQGIDQLVPDDSERANARLSSPSPIAGCNPLEKASFIEASGARSSSFKQFRAPEITQPVHLRNLLSERSSSQ